MQTPPAIHVYWVPTPKTEAGVQLFGAQLQVNVSAENSETPLQLPLWEALSRLLDGLLNEYNANAQADTSQPQANADNPQRISAYAQRGVAFYTAAVQGNTSQPLSTHAHVFAAQLALNYLRSLRTLQDCFAGFPSLGGVQPGFTEVRMCRKLAGVLDVHYKTRKKSKHGASADIEHSSESMESAQGATEAPLLADTFKRAAPYFPRRTQATLDAKEIANLMHISEEGVHALREAAMQSIRKEVAEMGLTPEEMIQAFS